MAYDIAMMHRIFVLYHSRDIYVFTPICINPGMERLGGGDLVVFKFFIYHFAISTGIILLRHVGFNMGLLPFPTSTIMCYTRLVSAVILHILTLVSFRLACIPLVSCAPYSGARHRRLERRPSRPPRRLPLRRQTRGEMR